MKIKFLVIAIFLLGAFLRLYRFTSNPPGLYIDEVAIGYSAYSINETGKDEWGNIYPLLFRSLEDYKPPLYIYTVAAFEKVFGVNETAVRLPSILAGILSPLILYFLLKDKKRLALLTMLLLAIAPWHIQFSRAGFEANLALLFILMGIWQLNVGIKNKKLINYVFSAIFFAASIYTYHSARLFSPLVVLLFAFIYRKELFLQKKNIIVVVTVGMVLMLPFIPTYFSKEGLSRFNSESFLKMPGNPIVNFFNNYVGNFSLEYLFFKGDQAGRHSVKKIGELFVWQLPLILFGVYYLIKQKSKLSWLVFGWVLLGALPPAVTTISPHALRGLEMVIPWQILTAFGLLVICRKLLIKLLVISLLIYSLVLYLHLYYVHYPVAYAVDWNNGLKETFDYVKNIEQNYDEIYFYQGVFAPGADYMHMLFYLSYDPKLYQLTGHNTKNIGKYHFDPLNELPVKSDLSKKYLMIDATSKVGSKIPILNEIVMINKDSLFRIYEY